MAGLWTCAGRRSVELGEWGFNPIGGRLHITQVDEGACSHTSKKRT
jgi:hypothetical protein